MVLRNHIKKFVSEVFLFKNYTEFECVFALPCNKFILKNMTYFYKRNNIKNLHFTRKPIRLAIPLSLKTVRLAHMNVFHFHFSCFQYSVSCKPIYIDEFSINKNRNPKTTTKRQKKEINMFNNV